MSQPNAAHTANAEKATLTTAHRQTRHSRLPPTVKTPSARHNQATALNKATQATAEQASKAARPTDYSTTQPSSRANAPKKHVDDAHSSRSRALSRSSKKGSCTGGIRTDSQCSRIKNNSSVARVPIILCASRLSKPISALCSQTSL